MLFRTLFYGYETWTVNAAMENDKEEAIEVLGKYPEKGGPLTTQSDRKDSSHKV